ncbi:short-chain dehydrogenase reductase 3b-like [Magnolia sinica]|uniref:short-chain dehydrogenase reductase 3b-like n=1 Tax=Magnolia sinica TaxID=86752 RepID=UPI0026592CCC|nr:short-chain dehydrogenase reductase 3b-like [Magnolia sinica]
MSYTAEYQITRIPYFSVSQQAHGQTIMSSEAISRKRLDGKVAIITGGASGIGEATARLFAAEGARAVVIADIQDERGKRVAASIGTDQCIYLHCDVADEGQVRSMVEHTVQTYGRLDIMFSNAGMINLTQTILDIDLEAMDRLFAVNVRGMVACVKYAGRAMVQGQIKGNIICTASVAATVGTEVRTDYTMSKHAVLGLVRSASIQLGRHGIRVNCVSPYAVATPLLCGTLGMDAEAVEKKFSSIPKLQGVVLKVEHIADAVLFLATGESAFVSGHNLVVDGAFLAR